MSMRSRCHGSRGFTLVELMVAMLLGLIVIGGATSIMLANKQSYRANEALSQVQETARTAFELLARDLRQAGATGCDNSGRVGSVLKTTGSQWWLDWGAITGYDGSTAMPAVDIGSAATERIDGTDAFEIRGTDGMAYSVETHDASAASIKLNATLPAIQVNDVLLVCDFDHATIFQVSQYTSANATLLHATGATQQPGNCTKGLGFPPAACDTNPGNTYTFGPNSQVARLAAVSWYIGNNNRPDEGGRSLYRRRLGAGATVSVEEVVAGVRDLQLQYRVEGSNAFVDASAMSASDWQNVNAVMLRLTMDSTERNIATAQGANSGRLERTFTHLVTLRNRVP